MAKILAFTSTGLILLVIGAYILLFTPARPLIPLKTPSTSVDVVRVIGSLPETKKGNTEGIMGGGDLCYISPECQEVLKRKGDNGWSQEELESLTEEERNNCVFGECKPFPGSVWAGEREEIRLELTDTEVNELMKLYLPKEVKLNDITLLFEQGRIFVNTRSYYPFAPGFVTAEATKDRYGFKLTSLYLGKISTPESFRKMVEDNIDPIITDSLSGYGVTIAIMEMQDDRLSVIGEAPKGLIKREGGVLVINFDSLTKVTPIPSENRDGDMRILN